MVSGDAETSRRRLLKGAAATGLLYGGVGAATSDEQEPFDEAVSGAASATGEASEAVYQPKIETVVAPLAMNPAIREGRETLRVELDVYGASVEDPSVTVRPTFGSVRPETELRDVRVTGEGESSELWLDGERTDVTVLEARLPPVGTPSAGRGATVAPGLYDVSVSWNDGEESDAQPRSLSLHESFPEEPRIYVVSDAHAGDPRALESGLEESAEEGDPEPFLHRYENVLGVGTDTERWGGFRRAVAEVSALDPDVVLFPGDFAFGQDAPKKYYQEYADAYAMLSALRAPVYTAVGNHDGYVQGTTDGKEIYHEFVGPWYWSRELREGLRLTCVDTYDWRPLDRLGASYGVSAWGGQVREEQLERLRDVLEAWHDPGADQVHLAFGHHSPAWRRDAGNEVHDETEGTPVAEQIGRGAGDFATGGSDAQAWRGTGRLGTRALLRDVDTLVYLCGHEHRDRLSREMEGGAIVYTPDGSADLGAYEPADDGGDDDVSERYDRQKLRSELRTGDGTLYVDATTAGSETDQYWGWRYFDVDGDGIDPAAFGYLNDDAEAAEAFLEERAVDADAWPADHAALGRYSHPTFEFDVERIETGDDAVAVRAINDLRSERSGALLLELPFADRPSVEGGELLWQRVDDRADAQDVAVSYAVAANSEREVRVEPRGR